VKLQGVFFITPYQAVSCPLFSGVKYGVDASCGVREDSIKIKKRLTWIAGLK
jgi:hypothetical protein